MSAAAGIPAVVQYASVPAQAYAVAPTTTGYAAPPQVTYSAPQYQVADGGQGLSHESMIVNHATAQPYNVNYQPAGQTTYTVPPVSYASPHFTYGNPVIDAGQSLYSSAPQVTYLSPEAIGQQQTYNAVTVASPGEVAGQQVFYQAASPHVQQGYQIQQAAMPQVVSHMPEQAQPVSNFQYAQPGLQTIDQAQGAVQQVYYQTADPSTAGVQQVVHQTVGPTQADAQQVYYQTVDPAKGDAQQLFYQVPGQLQQPMAYQTIEQPQHGMQQQPAAPQQVVYQTIGHAQPGAPQQVVYQTFDPAQLQMAYPTVEQAHIGAQNQVMYQAASQAPGSVQYFSTPQTVLQPAQPQSTSYGPTSQLFGGALPDDQVAAQQFSQQFQLSQQLQLSQQFQTGPSSAIPSVTPAQPGALQSDQGGVPQAMSYVMPQFPVSGQQPWLQSGSSMVAPGNFPITSNSNAQGPTEVADHVPPTQNANDQNTLADVSRETVSKSKKVSNSKKSNSSKKKKRFGCC